MRGFEMVTMSLHWGCLKALSFHKGAIHRLENRTQELVVLIEVQTGSYTGEDDIERLEDIYGRIR